MSPPFSEDRPEYYESGEGVSKEQREYLTRLVYQIYDETVKLKPGENKSLAYDKTLFNEEVFIDAFCLQFNYGILRRVILHKTADSSQWAEFTFEIVGDELCIQRNPSLSEIIWKSCCEAARNMRTAFIKALR